MIPVTATGRLKEREEKTSLNPSRKGEIVRLSFNNQKKRKSHTFQSSRLIKIDRSAPKKSQANGKREKKECNSSKCTEGKKYAQIEPCYN